LDNFDLRKYARAGAEVRLKEIDAERQQIFSAFPELRSGTASGERQPRAARTGAAKAGTARKRRRMSAEARKRISDAQKRRWAAHRAKEKR
jgi:hypothetical protein